VTRNSSPQPSAVSVIARTGAIRHARRYVGYLRRTTCEIVTLFRRKSCLEQSRARTRRARFTHLDALRSRRSHPILRCMRDFP